MGAAHRDGRCPGGEGVHDTTTVCRRDSARERGSTSLWPMRVKNELREWHAVTQSEATLLAQLLPEGRSCRASLLMQVRVGRCRWIESRGQPALLFATTGSPCADRISGVVGEGVAMDQDGVRIHFLAHVSDGVLKEIEVFREDGNAMIAFPSPSTVMPE